MLLWLDDEITGLVIGTEHSDERDSMLCKLVRVCTTLYNRHMAAARTRMEAFYALRIGQMSPTCRQKQHGFLTNRADVLALHIRMPRCGAAVCSRWVDYDGRPCEVYQYTMCYDLCVMDMPWIRDMLANRAGIYPLSRHGMDMPLCRHGMDMKLRCSQRSPDGPLKSVFMDPNDTSLPAFVFERHAQYDSEPRHPLDVRPRSVGPNEALRFDEVEITPKVYLHRNVPFPNPDGADVSIVLRMPSTVKVKLTVYVAGGRIRLEGDANVTQRYYNRKNEEVFDARTTDGVSALATALREHLLHHTRTIRCRMEDLLVLTEVMWRVVEFKPAPFRPRILPRVGRRNRPQEEPDIEM